MLGLRPQQAATCDSLPGGADHSGRWYSPREDGTFWRVWSCPHHTEGLTGLGQFGGSATHPIG